MEERKIFRGVNSIKFNQYFKNDAECLKYLSAIKWMNGFRYKRCDNNRFCSGRKEYNRRCTKCGFDESPTFNTKIDKLKFPILIAFHIAFKIRHQKKKECPLWN